MLTSLAITALVTVLALCVGVYAYRRTKRLEFEVVQDSLTGAGNRRGFERFIDSLPEGSPLAMVMIDFDNFKDINDQHGHAAGDAALVRVTQAMREVVKRAYRENAHVFRLGGDEFVIIVQMADSLHASALIERAREFVSESLELHERVLTISCGIACSPEHAVDVQELISYSDRALYQAKHLGRNRTVVYSPKMLDSDFNRESQGVLRALADALAAAVDAKDAYTHAHSRNVSDLSLYLARTMGFDADTVSDIALGGLLHDIGKIGVSDHVLRKPGRLNDEEWEEIKTHCDIGYTILSGIEGAEHIREMVLYHHERPDGTGYPRGLRGEEIPVPARIIAVADAFDSMTAERVYSKPRTPDEAIAEIVRLSGAQFDPSVVEALCQLMVYDKEPQVGASPVGSEDVNVTPDERAA